MLRILAGFLNRSSFSALPPHSAPELFPQNTETVRTMPFWKSFQQGVDLTHNNSLEEANRHYHRALNQLEERKETMMEHYLHIYKKYDEPHPGSSRTTTH